MARTRENADFPYSVCPRRRAWGVQEDLGVTSLVEVMNQRLQQYYRLRDGAGEG